MVKDHLSPPLIPSKLNGRKMELALIVECRGVLDRIMTGLKTDTQREAARIAGMVMDIRGYGQVMQQSVDKVRVEIDRACLKITFAALTALGRRIARQPSRAVFSGSLETSQRKRPIGRVQEKVASRNVSAIIVQSDIGTRARHWSKIILVNSCAAPETVAARKTLIEQ